MLRFVSSLLVMLLGAAAPTGRRPVKSSRRLRARQPKDDDATVDRALETAERPRDRARDVRPTWPGYVELVFDTRTVHVAGTWALETVRLPHAASANADVANADVANADVAPLPSPVQNPAAWALRVQQVLTFQEPGTRLRIADTGERGWHSLEIDVPTKPPTIVQVDRQSLGRMLGGDVDVRFRIAAG